MSGPQKPDASPQDTPPPEVPEEFAAAYTEAYRRALESGRYDELARQEVVAVGAHSTHGEHPAGLLDRARGARWGLPALLTGLALVLVLGAYGVGRLVSGGDSGPDASGSGAEGNASPSRGTSPSTSPTGTQTQATTPAGAWDGKVGPVTPSKASATCTSRPSVDSSGKRVDYTAANTLDDDPATAWRCDGPALGEKLTFELPGGTEVAEVGLIPGYAKTDAKSGADRYVENNRITRVRWTFGDTSVVQNFDPDPTARDVQRLRVPKTEADQVTCEILEVSRGPRNTTAISGVVFSEAD